MLRTAILFLGCILACAAGFAPPPGVRGGAVRRAPRCVAPVRARIGAADEAEGGVPLPARWAGMQGLTDLGFLFLLSSYTGRDLVDLFQDSATKYIVFGPALLTAGVVGNQFRLPERPDFEQNPVVKFLGGPARVRNFRDKLFGSSRSSFV